MSMDEASSSTSLPSSSESIENLSLHPPTTACNAAYCDSVPNHLLASPAFPAAPAPTPCFIIDFKPTPKQIISGIAPHLFPGEPIYRNRNRNRRKSFRSSSPLFSAPPGRPGRSRLSVVTASAWDERGVLVGQIEGCIGGENGELEGVQRRSSRSRSRSASQSRKRVSVNYDKGRDKREIESVTTISEAPNATPVAGALNVRIETELKASRRTYLQNLRVDIRSLHVFKTIAVKLKPTTKSVFSSKSKSNNSNRRLF